ncbi:hypothetical protein K6V78_10855 [Streptococcus gallolyticus]|nr:hypothetical protein [Streptococcus gallolyticus]MBY5042056.1 hypothetical protein [Streptococcus gallolyticus]
MEFKLKMWVTQEEQDYINGVVGYSLAKEKDYLIYSETERIYRLIIQFYNPNPDCPQDEIHIILYKGAIIKLTYSYYKEGEIVEIYFKSILVPSQFKDEEEKIIEIVKGTDEAIGAGIDGIPSQEMITYPKGFPLTYNDEIMIPVV